MPDRELRELRARFLSREGWVGYDDALRWLEARDAALAAAGRLVLWFEHDLYDQLQLIQVLAASGAPAALAQADRHLPEVELAELTPEPVTDEQRAYARRAWDAFRASDPRALGALAADDGAELPFVRDALGRLLEEVPAVENGLARSESQALEAVGAGSSTAAAAFTAAQAGEEAKFMGDASFDVLLRRIEPLVGSGDELAITPLGERVLAGGADFVTDRWIGGVRIRPPAPAWRWDAVDRRLVTMLAG